MACILIIEDNEIVAMTISLVIAKIGHEVQIVNSGQEAKKYLAENELPELILLDWILPDMLGIDILKYIQALTCEKIPVIIVTAKDDPGVATDGLNAGADDFLPKPFDPRELEARIRSVGRRYALDI